MSMCGYIEPGAYDQWNISSRDAWYNYKIHQFLWFISPMR
jgi:hypothetical protein